MRTNLEATNATNGNDCGLRGHAYVDCRTFDVGNIFVHSTDVIGDNYNHGVSNDVNHWSLHQCICQTWRVPEVLDWYGRACLVNGTHAQSASNFEIECHVSRSQDFSKTNVFLGLIGFGFVFCWSFIVLHREQCVQANMLISFWGGQCWALENGPSAPGLLFLTPKCGPKRLKKKMRRS